MTTHQSAVGMRPRAGHGSPGNVLFLYLKSHVVLNAQSGDFCYIERMEFKRVCLTPLPSDRSDVLLLMTGKTCEVSLPMESQEQADAFKF